MRDKSRQNYKKPKLPSRMFKICYNKYIFGPLAQLVEQTPLKRKVVSSSLTWPTFFVILKQLIDKDGWRNW